MAAVDLFELVVDRGEDVLDAFDLIEPAALAGFVELVDQPVTGAFQAGPGVGVGAGELAYQRVAIARWLSPGKRPKGPLVYRWRDTAKRRSER